jgi:transposase
LVSPRHLEANFRYLGGEIARQSVSDRQHDRESPSRSQRRKRGEQNQAIGISRGGRSTKIHAIVDSKGRPLNFMVTGGQVHDSQVVGDVLDTPTPPLAVTADKAYDSEKVRQQIKDEGALPVIPSRSHQESLLSQALLPPTPQNRELLLPHQRLAAHRHALR